MKDCPEIGMSQWRLTPGNDKSPLPPFSKGGIKVPL